jgi:hypothetical protein
MKRERPIPDKDKKLTEAFDNPDDFVAYLETTVLQTSSLSLLEKAIENINRARAEHKKRFGYYNKKVEALRRKFYRRRKELLEYSGDITAPSLVRRNINHSLETLKGMDLQIDSNVTMEDAFVQELGKREALYVMDCIGSYVNDYREGGSSAIMQLVNVDDNPFYLINDTFDNFCKRGGIKGRDKRFVKDYLFGDKKKPYGPLNSVSMVIPTEDGKHKLVDMDFISVSLIERNPANKSPKRVTDETGRFVSDQTNEGEKNFYQVDRFTMQLNHRLYRYAEHKIMENTIQGEIPPTELKHLGYSSYPKAFTAKIKGLLKTLQGFDDVYSNIGLGRALERDLDKFVRGMHAIHEKWQTGAANRKRFMVIDWQELHNKAGFPKYSKGRGKHKYEDLDVIARMAIQLITDKEAFTDCADVFVVRQLTELPESNRAEILQKNPDIRVPFLLFVVNPAFFDKKEMEEEAARRIARK